MANDYRLADKGRNILRNNYIAYLQEKGILTWKARNVLCSDKGYPIDEWRKVMDAYQHADYGMCNALAKGMERKKVPHVFYPKW